MDSDGDVVGLVGRHKNVAIAIAAGERCIKLQAAVSKDELISASEFADRRILAGLRVV